jgi:glutamate-ammonia-ligase adenylyltransferase
LLDAACAAGALGREACGGLRAAHAVLLDAGLRCTLDRRMRLVPEDEAIAAARAAVRDTWKAIGLA